MSLSEQSPPASIARNLFQRLCAQSEHMTIDQHLQLAQLAAQIGIGDRLSEIDSRLRGLEASTDTWIENGLFVHTDNSGKPAYHGGDFP